MSDSGQNKTERATRRKREKARRKGDVVDSKDLSAGITLLGTAILFILFGAGLAESLKLTIRDHLGGLASANLLADGAAAVELVRATIRSALGILAPLLGVVTVLAIGGQLAMHGLVWSPEKLEFKPDKVNPFTGFKKLFSLSGVLRAVFAMLKLAAIAAVVILSVRGRWGDIVSLGLHPAATGVGTFFDLLLMILLRVGIAVLVLGIADYAFQRWKKERDMRMTKQEVKEERKQTEGDPMVKRKILGHMQKRALQRMMDGVDSATVVVTNPTRFAVALAYRRGEDPAPRVVAKGVDHLARQIRERARKADVPLVEDKPLARTLWRTVEVGDFVPADLYRAVAAILSYVYRMEGIVR